MEDENKELTYNEKEIVKFVVEFADEAREFIDQNYRDDWDRYERIFRGKWEAEDKIRDSERSRVISPATQQAIETAHAEKMEAIFGQGEYFDIEDDVMDVTQTPLDVEQFKKRLQEDFEKDKIRKSIDQIGLMASIYGTGIGEIVVSTEKCFKPAMMPVGQGQMAYGTKEEERISIKITPVNPKNFLFDPNASSVDESMGVAIEKYISAHKIVEGMATGKYRKTKLTSIMPEDSLEPTQETTNFDLHKVKVLTYYGLVPTEYLKNLKKAEESEKDEKVEEVYGEEMEDYADMTEAIIVIANDEILLKAEESPYMMKDRPVLTYQDDTVPNRLLGRGVAEKAYNMQMAIDGSMRSHMDALALTVAPMVGLDATRLPRGAKFEVKPGKAFLTNGAPSEIISPFTFGTNDGAAMTTAKEFERMLLMATATVDSGGNISNMNRDSNIDASTATIIKKYKRSILNFQEDFLIPFIYKAAWRRMQFDPERYPSVDVKFVPKGTLGIIAREFEQKQLAFLIQTLGADSPITPVLMQGILKNSSLSDREAMIQQLQQMSQPDPQAQQNAQAMVQLQQQLLAAQAAEAQAKANMNNALAQLDTVKAQLQPEVARAEIMSAMTKNLPSEADLNKQLFEQRAKIAELAIKEKDIESNETITRMQMEQKAKEKQIEKTYLEQAANG